MNVEHDEVSTIRRLKASGMSTASWDSADAWNKISTRAHRELRTRRVITGFGLAASVTVAALVGVNAFIDDGQAEQAAPLSVGANDRPVLARGTAPSLSRTDTGTTYRVPVGDRDIAVFISSTVRNQDLPQVVPDAGYVVTGDPTTPRTGITHASAAEVLRDACSEMSGVLSKCDPPTLNEGTTLPNGAVLQQWELLTEDVFTTVQMDGWVLVLRGPQRENASQIAEAITWDSEPSTGWLRLGSDDASVSGPPDATTLILGTGSYNDLTRIEISAGCEPGEQSSADRPVIIDALTARWCAQTVDSQVTVTAPMNGDLPIEQLTDAIQVGD